MTVTTPTIDAVDKDQSCEIFQTAPCCQRAFCSDHVARGLKLVCRQILAGSALRRALYGPRIRATECRRTRLIHINPDIRFLRNCDATTDNFFTSGYRCLLVK